MDREAYEAEVRRLNAFIMRLADKLAAASEVIAKNAEKKQPKEQPPCPPA